MGTEIDTVPPPDAAGDLNLAIARPLFAYLEHKHGVEGLKRLGAATGIDEQTLLKPQRWVTLTEFENVLTAVRDIVETDANFMEACCYEMVKSYGPLALVVRTGTVLITYRVLAATAHFVSRISTYKLAQSTRNSVTLEYRSKKPESRLMCLSRQAQLPTLPTMFWNLAPAQLIETTCIARGDECCKYHLKWSEPLAWRWPLVGLALGLVTAFVMRPFGMDHIWSVPIIGALFGAAFAFRLMVKQALDFHTETTNQIGDFVREHQSAVEQVMDLHSRQEAFNSLMAERVEARTSTLEAMLTELNSVRARSEVAVLGLTHDMKNPLAGVMMNAQAMIEQSQDPAMVAVGKDIHEGASRVKAQLTRLLEIATADKGAFALHNRQIEIAPLVDRTRRNLNALVIARDIRVSVFRTREAPDTIESDVMLFDRIIDNLISNAVKYTDRGSVIVEVGGSPGHLSFKISDTGRGISPDRLEKVFVGGTRDAKPMLGESHGIGLANTIRLLDELGGRLEVMSKPNVGTTIWAHIPVEPPKRDERTRRSVDASEVLRRVVTIRSAANQ